MAVVLWQLGAEPFTAAAIGWGTHPGRLGFAVAGDPRNRDLAFAALLKFARWFNPLFESHSDQRESVEGRTHNSTLAITAPQILVANQATVNLLGRLGRRLAYLPIDGTLPADPDLVRLGRNLIFLWNHYAVPGQQLVVPLAELLAANWATPQSEVERQSIAAVDAFIDPPQGLHGFEAAALAERVAVGPLPSGEDDERLDPLVERFHEHRRGSTNPTVVTPLLRPIEDHYRPLVRGAWELIWRCRDRELGLPEAPSTTRRWDEDRWAYTQHMDWMARGGLRRTRQSPRQAVRTLRRLEDAKQLLEAEEACGDPLRMIPYLIEGKAVLGRIVQVDGTNREMAERAMVRRPLVTLQTLEPCNIPLGRELWWSEQPAGREFVVQGITPQPSGGALVVLKLMTGSGRTAVPPVGTQACFSSHSTKAPWQTVLPDDDPWTHQPSQPLPQLTPIEAEHEELVRRGG
jgi:hypothetical protein